MSAGKATGQGGEATKAASLSRSPLWMTGAQFGRGPAQRLCRRRLEIVLSRDRELECVSTHLCPSLEDGHSRAMNSLTFYNRLPHPTLHVHVGARAHAHTHMRAKHGPKGRELLRP